MKKKKEYLVAGAILAVSFLVSGWIVWTGTGPVEGAMQEIETEDYRILQRAEGRWYAPNYWEAYTITRKDLTEVSWVRSRDEGVRLQPNISDQERILDPEQDAVGNEGHHGAN